MIARKYAKTPDGAITLELRSLPWGITAVESLDFLLICLYFLGIDSDYPSYFLKLTPIS